MGYFLKPHMYNSQVAGYLIRRYPGPWVTLDAATKKYWVRLQMTTFWCKRATRLIYDPLVDWCKKVSMNEPFWPPGDVLDI
jgi:hypothetical protein